MSNNAQWRVHWYSTDGTQHGYLYLSSPDLARPVAAKKRALQTAKARLEKKTGLKVVTEQAVCVG